METCAGNAVMRAIAIMAHVVLRNLANVLGVFALWHTRGNACAS